VDCADAGAGVTVDEPVFIAGLDRTGKTPLRIALGAPRSLCLTRRLPLWTSIYGRYGNLQDRRSRGRLLAVLAATSPPGLVLDSAKLALALDAARSYRALFEEIGRQLCEQNGASRWGIQEAMLEWHADAVLREFPRARIIHMVRDPRDRIAVIQRSGAGRRGGIGSEVGAWVGSVGLAYRNAAKHPDAYRVIRFEDLVQQPGVILRAACEFLGVPLDSGSMNLEISVRRDDVGLYRSTLSAGEVSRIQRRAGKLMTTAGYELDPVPAGAEKLPMRAVNWGFDHMGSVAWRLRSRRFRRFGLLPPAAQRRAG
jgi:hypothetical protein